MPRKKNYVRNDILGHAMQVFWVKGYSATSINDLVEGTGVNRFSLYNEFEDKEKLYLECFDEYKRTVMEARMTALENDTEGLECLHRFFIDYIGDVKKGLKTENMPVSCLTVLNAVESIGRESVSSKTMVSIIRRMEAAFKAVLRRAVEKKEIDSKVDFHQCALFLIGCTYGLDIMSKFLNAKELTMYVNQVLGGLK